MADASVRTKRCCTCKTDRPTTDFWKQTRSRDGLQSTCKACTLARQKTPVGMERIRRAARKYVRSPRGRAKQRAYAKTDKAKAWLRRYRFANLYRTDKHRAQCYIGAMVRYGKMPSARTLTCIRCGKQAEHYHHHLGHSREHRLDVVPVCALCHKALEPHHRRPKSQQ